MVHNEQDEGSDYMKYSVPELIDFIYKIAMFIYSAASYSPPNAKYEHLFEESNYVKFSEVLQ